MFLPPPAKNRYVVFPKIGFLVLEAQVGNVYLPPPDQDQMLAFSKENF